MDWRPVKTIILFEDEQAISDVFRSSFERMEYKVRQAATRRTATKIAAHSNRPINLLVADMIGRVSTRVRLAQAMTSTHPEMAVLFISGVPPAELTNRGWIDSEILAFPHVEFLQKPFLPWLLKEHSSDCPVMNVAIVDSNRSIKRRARKAAVVSIGQLEFNPWIRECIQPPRPKSKRTALLWNTTGMKFLRRDGHPEVSPRSPSDNSGHR